MLTLVALTPLIIVCTALAFRISSITSALISIASLLILAALFFPYDADRVRVTADALWLPIIEIALIILGGILIAELLERVGAQSYITEKLIAATGTRERATLLMSIGLVSFLESSIGFGLGILITVPLLYKMGYSATKSVALSLFGLTLTPWGSLGPGLIVTAELGGIPLHDLGVSLSIIGIVQLSVLNFAVLFIAVPRAQVLKTYFVEVLVVTVLMWVALVITNVYISVPLGGIFAGLIGILAILLIARLKGTKQRSLFDRRLLTSASPYLVLILGVVLSSVLFPLFQVPLLTRIMTSPATWLLLSVCISAPILGFTMTRLVDLFGSSTKRWIRPCTVVLLFVILGGLLNASGMSSELARAASQLGFWNLLLIPGVNILTGYVTSSIGASGAMFSLSAAQTATQLGFSQSSILALMSYGSANATIVSPSRFALAASGFASIGIDQLKGKKDLPPEQRVQVGKIVLGGISLVLLMLPFNIAITWIFGHVAG